MRAFKISIGLAEFSLGYDNERIPTRSDSYICLLNIRYVNYVHHNKSFDRSLLLIEKTHVTGWNIELMFFAINTFRK